MKPTIAVSLFFVPALAAAQPAQTEGRVAQKDAAALVEGPGDGTDAPTIEKGSDGITAAVSAGGMLSTGNTRTQALTLNGTVDWRKGLNGLGFSALANYGASALRGEDMRTTAENFQLRGRYDRFVTDRFALFLQGTERYDRFQGLASRTNIDPGVKYIFWKPASSALWGELGYDFQYDIRTQTGRHKFDADGNDITNQPAPTGGLLNKTLSDHSARAFVGFRHAFNTEVTFSTGLEYLQSFVTTELATANTRINYDATLAAKLYGGIAAGIGFTARWDRTPLPGRSNLDTATTLSLIYAFSDVKTPEAAEPVCPACPEVPPCNDAAPADPTMPSTLPPATQPAPVEPAPTVEPEARLDGPYSSTPDSNATASTGTVQP